MGIGGCREILKIRLIVFSKILKMGSIPSRKHELEVLEILNMGSRSSRKHEMAFFENLAYGTNIRQENMKWTCCFQLKDLKQLRDVLFAIKGM